MLIGALFFFAKQFAPDAPLLWRFSKATSYAFGETWLVVFFILCVLVGIFILCKGYLMKTLIKQFICLMFLTSAILNFQAIEEWKDTLVNRTQSIHHGWYCSWPIYRVLESVFGPAKLAIQILIILMLLWVLAWVLYVLNVKLPKLPKINIEKEGYSDGCG